MSNMSYCQFENTFGDLRDCLEALDNNSISELVADASEYERPYIKRLIDMCKEISDNYGDYQESDFEVDEDENEDNDEGNEPMVYNNNSHETLPADMDEEKLKSDLREIISTEGRGKLHAVKEMKDRTGWSLLNSKIYVDNL